MLILEEYLLIPIFLNNKPENKKVVKIKTEYNTECECDYEFKKISDFFSTDITEL